MILISTIRKMLQRNPAATVIQMTVSAHTVTLPGGSVAVPARVEYFATDRQAGEAQYREADTLRSLGLNAADLVRICDVPANVAALAQGFDYSQTIEGVK